MSALKDFETNGSGFVIDIDEAGLTGLSALLSCPPVFSCTEQQAERRAGRDRRISDRRVAARTVSE